MFQKGFVLADTFIVIAVIFFLGVCGMAILTCSEPPIPSYGHQIKPEGSESNRDNRAANIDNPQPGTPGASAKFKGIYTAPNHYEQKGKKETSENRWTAPDGFTAIFTGFLILVGTAQVWLFWVQLRFIRIGLADTKNAADAAKISADAAMGSTEVAKTTFTMANRPWIAVDMEIASDLTYDSEGTPRVTIKFILTNIGHSPAANIQVDAVLLPIFGNAAPFQKEIASRIGVRTPKVSDFGITIFPSGRRIMSIDMPIQQEATKAFTCYSEDSFEISNILRSTEHFCATLIGSVNYKYTFAEGHHQTGFICRLVNFSDEFPKGSLTFARSDKIIPRSRLALHNMFDDVPPT
jgi:hypothetical protein